MILTPMMVDSAIQKDLLTSISSYQDLYMTKEDIQSRIMHREVISLHCFNHILKYLTGFLVDAILTSRVYPEFGDEY